MSRGPRATFAAVSIALVSLIPFAFVTLVTGRRNALPPWTEVASVYTLEVLLLALPVLAIVALVSFGPRHDFVPDARAIRRR